MPLHCYILSYDLSHPLRDYSSFYMAIKQFPQWGRLTMSTWAIVSELPALEILKMLQTHLGPNDRIIVVQSGRSAAWNKLLASNDWVRNALVK